MRESLTKEKRFLGYFRTFTILVLTLCITMTVALSMYTDHLLRSETRTNAHNTFALLMHSHNALFDQLDDVFSSLFDNQQYTEFPHYYQNNEVNKQILIRDQLNSTLLSMKALRNICLYYPQDDITFSTDQTISSMELYHDAEFLFMLKHSGGAFSKTYVRQVQYISQSRPTKVVTMVRTLPVYSINRQVSAYLVVDLDFAAISQVFEQLVADNDSSMLVFDETDTLISAIGEAYPQEALFPQGLTRTKDISFFETQLNGETLYVYASTIADPAWSYVFIQNLSQTGQRLRQVQTIIVLICLCVMLCALVYAWYASKRLYRPLRRVSVQLGDTGRDVFDHIEDMIEENERLNTALQDNIVTGRNHQLLHQALIGLNVPLNGNELHKMIPERSECAFFLIKTATDCDALAQERLTELLGAYGIRFMVKLYTASNEVAFIVTSMKFDVAGIHAAGQAILASIGEAEEASIGVSRPFADMKEVAQAYQQAKEALGMYLVRGAGSCCCFLEIRNKLAPDYPYPLENAILRAFRSGNREELAQYIKEFEAYLVQQDCLPQHVRDFYTQLFCSCQRLMVDYNRRASGAYPYSHREILTLGSIVEMSDYILQMLVRLMDASGCPGAERSELIDSVCAYIDEHLCDLETVDHLAAKFYVSITTLRSEFSRVVGTSLKVYIDQRRMVKAKQMLAETDLRVQEIASCLGFHYSQSFISFFKSNAGMTPGEYRERASGGFSGGRQPDGGITS